PHRDSAAHTTRHKKQAPPATCPPRAHTALQKTHTTDISSTPALWNALCISLRRLSATTPSATGIGSSGALPRGDTEGRKAAVPPPAPLAHPAGTARHGLAATRASGAPPPRPASVDLAGRFYAHRPPMRTLGVPRSSVLAWPCRITCDVVPPRRPSLVV